MLRITALCLALVAHSSTAQDVDLSCRLKAGTKVAVEVDLAAKVRGTVVLDGAPKHKDFEESVSMAMVDVVVSDRYPLKTSRRYVRWHSEVDGRVKDPAIQGRWVDFEVGDTPRCRLREGGVSNDFLDRLFAHVFSVGGTLALPEKARVGQSFEVKLVPLMPLALDLDRYPERALARVRFESYDASRGLATLTGRMDLATTNEEDGLSVELAGEGDVTIVVDTAARRLASLEASLGVSAKGTALGAPVRLEGKLTSRLRWSSGARVAELEAAKPVVRQRSFSVGGSGLRFELPSTWFRLGKDGDHRYARVTGDDEMSLIQLLQWQVDDPARAIAEVIADIEKDTPFRFAPSKTALGTGRSSSGEAKDGSPMAIEFMATKGIVFQFVVTLPKSAKGDLAGVVKALRAATVARD